MNKHAYHTVRFTGIFLFICIIANLAFLDLIFLREVSFRQENVSAVNHDVVVKSFDSDAKACDKECIDQLYESIKNATSSTKLTQPNSGSSQKGSTAVKEYFVNFGSGSSATDVWEDVIGLQAYVDSTQYGIMKSVVFEASLHIPTGNGKAYARLYNSTDKHPVWFSEVVLEGGQPQLLVSQPITLDGGNKLYQVQMKTSLKYQTNLAQSRLHILTN